jgi:hypothetical protein
MEQSLARIQVTITEEGITGVEVQADDPQQTKSAYTLLSYLAEDLHNLDELIQSKDLQRRLTEMRDFVSLERRQKDEAQLAKFLLSEVPR